MWDLLYRYKRCLGAENQRNDKSKRWIRTLFYTSHPDLNWFPNQSTVPLAAYWVVSITPQNLMRFNNLQDGMSITNRVSEICIEHLDEKEINMGSRNMWSISLPTCLNGSFILAFRKGTLHVCWSLYTLKYGCRWKCAYMTIKISVYASTTLDLIIGYDAINILYTNLWSEITVSAWCLSHIHYLAQIGAIFIHMGS